MTHDDGAEYEIVEIDNLVITEAERDSIDAALDLFHRALKDRLRYLKALTASTEDEVRSAMKAAVKKEEDNE